jgi:rubrerythrin
MNILSIHDVVEFAIRIEENGELFYREASRVAENEGAKHLFARLADEEVSHRKVFQNILSTLGDFRPRETYSGEYMAYLRDHIDGRAVFKKDMKDSRLPAIHHTISAIDFAVQRELDSVLYYQEISGFVPEKHYKTVDSILQEERKHFARLSELRKNCRA